MSVLDLQIAPGVPGVRIGSEEAAKLQRARAHIVGLRGPTRINGVEIELRPAGLDPDDEWAPLGIRLLVRPAEIVLCYDRRDRLGSPVFVEDGRLQSGPAISASAGDRIRAEDMKILPGDSTLAPWDQKRATASVCVEFSNGTVGDAPHRITFGHPLFVEPGAGKPLLRPSIDVLRSRLARLVTLATLTSADRILRNASDEARFRFERLETATQDFAAELAAVAPEFGFFMERVAEIQESAAAFGFTLGLAEAEISSRPAIRQSRGRQQLKGMIRGRQKADAAALWKMQALEVARRFDQGKGSRWTRSKLAQEILFDTAIDLSLKTVEEWLRSDAEEPNGPIRSRSKRPGKPS